MGIHNIEDKVQNRLENVQNSDKITEANKEYFQDFYNWLRTTGDRGLHRIHNYLFSLHKILKNHDFDLLPLNEEKLQSILVAIEDSEYKERGQGGYSKETKAEYRKTVKRICEKERKLDLLPKDRQGKIELKTHVPDSKKQRTRPDQLPTVEDANKIAKKIQERSNSYSVLRNLALFYVTYESGARIGEILDVRLRDIEIKDEKLIEIYIPGNKDSDDRKVAFVIASPILKRYLEVAHPCPDDKDAFLFCNIKENRGEQMSYENVSVMFNKAGKQADIETKFNPHVFRKKRISFLKIYMDLNESVIDKQVGHVPGSDTTRIYTRIDDKEVREVQRGLWTEGKGREQSREDTLVASEMFKLLGARRRTPGRMLQLRRSS